MSAGIFVDCDVMESRVAIIEDDRIAEIHIERVGESSIRGQIRRGRVKHISSDLQAATIDTGNGQNLFLRSADARVLGTADVQGKVPIAKLVTRGQMVLVQATRPGMDGKQSRCTADIALYGRYVTVHPMRHGLETGKGGDDAALITALTEIASEARITLRPAARNVSALTVQTEADRLLSDWREIQSSGKAAPGLVRRAQNLFERALTALSGPDPDVIMTPDRSTLAELKQLAAVVAPDLSDRIELTEKGRSIDLDAEIEAALGTGAKFDGGRLSIEVTRAMTVIDVDGQGTPIRANLAAIPEIARQLRLRRIGGPIAIDFVTMSKAQDRKLVESALRQALQKSVAQADVGGIDRFGIATLVLRRDGAALADDVAEHRPMAVRLSATAQLAKVLRRATLELSSVGPLPIVIELSDKLASAAPADLADQLAGRLNRPLKVRFGQRDVDDMVLSRER